MSKKYHKKIERYNYSSAEEIMDTPNLIDVQKKSFEELLKHGMKEVLDNISPIEDFTETLQLEFGDYHLHEMDKKTKKTSSKVYQKCPNCSKNADIKFNEEICKERDITYCAPLWVLARLKNKETGEIKEQPVFLGDFPLMTRKGTFIINGSERVVVNQIVRSPGIYFDREIDRETDETLFNCKLIPSRGAWLEMIFNKKGALSMRIDRKRKLPITTFLKALGFGDNEKLKDLFKNSEVIDKTLKVDTTESREEALIEVYKKQRPGEPPTLDSAEALIDNLFYKPKRYDLGRVGRYKLNKKLQLDIPLEKTTLSKEDILAIVRYMIQLNQGLGEVDDIDHFGNRRVRTVGELIQNQLRVGFSRIEKVVKDRMTTQDVNIVTPRSLINIRPMVAILRQFYGSSQLSQFLDQTNPLAELTHKRRLTAVGPGGLSRERAGFEVRDVHSSHYGRMCPIETPEGPNIGLIGSLATYARISDMGFIQTPYRKVEKGIVTDEIEYIDADEEEEFVIAQYNIPVNKKGKIKGKEVVVRRRGEVNTVVSNKVDHIDISPRQIFSVSTSLIPFLEHDDAPRALMGSNMQRQAVPLIKTEAPLIGTGMEHKAVIDSGDVILAKENGTVTKVCADYIEIDYKNLASTRHKLQKFRRSNQGTCINQKPLVYAGNKVKKNDVIIDGLAISGGELALGKNLLVAFLSWEGYNFEDAIVISERLVKEDVLSSIHIEKHEIEARSIKLGDEEITRDIPNVSEEALKDLDERGIIRIGAEVKAGDILVGKVTPKGETELTAEEKLLRAIFGEKAKEVRDTSLTVPHGESGKVMDVKYFSREEGHELAPGVDKYVRVYIAKKRKVSVGDKLSGRHGNKGVIAIILPEEDMPYMEDGTPVDVVLNPLGVPSRMNVGQILETHLGWAAKVGWDDDGVKRSDEGSVYISTPIFEGANENEIRKALKKAGLPTSGKTWLYDGRTGKRFKQPITVGYMYIMKLHHLVDDKIHARSTGPYSLVTQQPLGGKAQFGGQRFGEMEVWALDAYGAAYTLQEMLTIKSDDVFGRVKAYEAIVKGEPIEAPKIPESFKVLVKEIKSLGLNVEILSEKGEKLELIDTGEDMYRTIEELGISLQREEKDIIEILEDTKLSKN